MFLRTKIRILTICLLFFFTLNAFCGGTQESGDTGTGGIEEPVNVVFFINNGFNADTSSNQEQLDLLHEYFIDKINVDIEIITPPVDQVDEKLNLLLTSNQKVDCFWGDWQVFSEQRIVQPITDIYTKKDYPGIEREFGPYMGTMTDTEGNLWGLPRSFDTAPYPFIYRSDYADKVGFDHAPSTIEELNKLLYAFKTKDPAGNGKTIPLITTSIESLAWCLLGGYTDGGNALWFDEKDGKVKMPIVQPGYRDFIAQVAQWYSDGILYKESFNINVPQLRELVKEGRVASSLQWYSSMGVAIQQMYQANPETPAVGAFTHGLTGQKGICETALKGSTRGALFSVKSSAETIKAALDVFNLQLSDTTAWYNSTYGIDMWNFLEGSEETASPIQSDGNVGTKEYKGEYRVAIGKLRINEFMELLEKDTRYTSTNGETAGLFFYWLYDKNLYSPVMEIFQPFDFRLGFNNTQIEDEIFAMSDINRMIEEESVKFATGVQAMDMWDDFIDKLYKIGMADVENAYTDQYMALK